MLFFLFSGGLLLEVLLGVYFRVPFSDCSIIIDLNENI